MMQDGLHIGLAEWINQLGSARGFLNFPDLPVAVQLVDLEAVQDVSSLGAAAEFSRLVNFVPRSGPVGTGTGSPTLWEVHRDVLTRMDHATEPWDDVERATYAAARELLFTTDSGGLPSPTEQYLIYQELARCHRDLVDSGAAAGEVLAAMAQWLEVGHKLQIDNALEALSRMVSRSSREQAQNERALLNQHPPGLGLRFHGDLTFAPTYFAPVSAVRRDTWMKATATFAELDRAVGSTHFMRSKWVAYRANKTGEVSFEYVVLSLLRPWFSLELYRAEDWRLQSDGEVSLGNGVDGLLPAFVNTVIMVSVTDVKIRPASAPSGLTGVVSGTFSPILAAPTAAGTPVTTSVSPRRPLAALPNAAGGNVMPTSATLTEHRPQANVILRAQPATYTSLRPPNVLRVSGAIIPLRLSVTRAVLDRAAPKAPPASEQPPSSPIYVAGFSCEKVPLSPNPRADFVWS